jgi:glycosyltransferase involved in cell wall biosynthesis
MPTHDRRSFAGQAIWYFLRQDYPAAELIILDDGHDAIAHLVPPDPRIRYVRLAQPASPDEKRAIGRKLARGELIARWDDDCWSGPHRLSAQVDALLRADAGLCGGADLLHYFLAEGQAWRRRAAAPAPETLLGRHTQWQQHATAGDDDADAAVIAAAAPERIVALPDPDFYLAVVHAGSSVPRNLGDPAWERASMAEVDRRLALDRDFYVALRHGPQRADRSGAAASSVTVAATFVVYDGYGSMAEYLVLGMTRAGARVNVAPLRVDPAGLSDELRATLAASRPDPEAPVLCLAWWGENLDRFRGTGDLFVNTMWETSRLPTDWPPRLNRARAVIVPTRFVAETFRSSGVTVPIEVVPQGVDPAVYHCEERPERRGLTTLMVGVFVPRKNVDEGIAAWKRAFRGDPDARLIIKARFGWRHYQPDDPRIRFVDSNEPTRGIAHWYREADVLLALGNEGFGLPLVEGMATGLPVIALDAEGQSDVCADARGLLLPVSPARWQPFDEPPFGPCGVRGVPAVEDVAERLRWVATHRSEARAMGRAASAWALANRDIWSMGPAMLDAMERHLHRPRPLRRERVVWINGERACGADVQTAAALAALPATRVTTVPPDLRRARLLHIMHEPGAFEEAELTRTAQHARYAGIPVAVTVGAAGDRMRAWEREVDAFVARSASDVAALRVRWPAKRVELQTDGGAAPYLSLWQSLEADVPA